MILTGKQRKFLIYLCQYHKGVGYMHIIKRILEKVEYDNIDREYLIEVSNYFKGMCTELKTGQQQDTWYNIHMYNRPTKYLG